jgi:hypothetical protein
VQGRGEPALGLDELGEPAQPADEGLERFARSGQGGRGVGAGVDVMPEDGADQVGALREVAVEGCQADPPLVAISRAGASAPDTLKTSRTAVISASMLRWASPRTRRGGFRAWPTPTLPVAEVTCSES